MFLVHRIVHTVTMHCGLHDAMPRCTHQDATNTPRYTKPFMSAVGQRRRINLKPHYMPVSRASHRAYRHNTLWFARCNAKVYAPGCYQHTQVDNPACQPIRNTLIQSHITGRCFPCIASCIPSQCIVVRTMQCQGVRTRMLPMNTPRYTTMHVNPYATP